MDFCLAYHNLEEVSEIYYYFFIIVCPLVQPEASGWAHVTWSWHKRSQANSKPFSYYNTSVYNSNVKVKKIKSAGCADFTQLQTKLLQHLDDI